MRKYTTIDEIQNYMLQNIDLDFHYQVEKWIEAVSEHIEKMTGRVFEVDEATTKIYDGNGKKEIKVDEFIDIESIKIDDTEVDNYYLYPNNIANKDTIVLESGVFTKDYQNIEIEAKWGYSETIPYDIVLATTILVSGIINHSLSHEGEVQSFSMGRYSVAYKDQKGWNDYKDAMTIIDNYKLYTF